LWKGKPENVSDELEQQNWKKFAHGDADVWREFTSRQIPLLYRLFLKSWSNPSLAEDLVQKTIFDAVRGRVSYNPDKGSPEEWIGGIARNAIRLELRRRASRPGTNGELGRYFDAIDTKLLPDEVLERKETIDIVRKALSKLESKEETVLRAKYIEDLPVCEIAAEMNITEKAVHSLLYRAKISLREKLRHVTFVNNQGQE
jgi:RNA polymerase sigma-70 factor (ECF subfamily)